MAMERRGCHPIAETPARIAVAQLVAAGESAEIPAHAGPRCNAKILTLAAALSADPDEGEPIEDAYGGVPQNLACATAF